MLDYWTKNKYAVYAGENDKSLTVTKTISLVTKISAN